MTTPMEPGAEIVSYTGDLTGAAVGIDPWGGAYVRLKPGVTTLMVTWDGTGDLTVNLSDMEKYTARKAIATIPAGRHTKSLCGIGVKVDETRFLSLTGSGKGRATVVMIRFPPTA